MINLRGLVRPFTKRFYNDKELKIGYLHALKNALDFKEKTVIPSEVISNLRSFEREVSRREYQTRSLEEYADLKKIAELTGPDPLSIEFFDKHFFKNRV